MAATKYNFKDSAACEQGATFRRIITCVDTNNDPYDLTGYSARMQVRNSADEVLADLTDANGKIIIEAVDGIITLLMLAEETSGLPIERHLYDLELAYNETLPDEIVVRLLQGEFAVSKEITKEVI